MPASSELLANFVGKETKPILQFCANKEAIHIYTKDILSTVNSLFCHFMVCGGDAATVPVFGGLCRERAGCHSVFKTDVF